MNIWKRKKVGTGRLSTATVCTNMDMVDSGVILWAGRATLSLNCKMLGKPSPLHSAGGCLGKTTVYHHSITTFGMTFCRNRRSVTSCSLLWQMVLAFFSDARVLRDFDIGRDFIEHVFIGTRDWLSRS